MIQKMSKEDQLSSAGKSLMLKEPFYGLFLLMLNKKWTTTEIPTAGVCKHGINYQLIINDDFWGMLQHESRRGLLKHELLHIVLFHVLIDSNMYSEKEILALAIDLEVNQYIDPGDLPPGPVLLSTYPELKLDERAGYRYYYDELMKAHQNGSCPNLDRQIQSMKDARGTGKCGIGPKGENLPDHGTWDEFEKLSEAERGLVKRQVDFQLQEVADQVKKSRGTIPGELSGYIDSLVNQEPPKFDWKGYLRRFAGGSTKVYTKKLRRKFNKRFEENPGLKIKPKKHILVAVDTSGSVSKDELEEFFQEIAHIHKTGAEVTVVQADAAISHIEPFKKRSKMAIHGRGGTDFQPVCDYYSKNLNRYTCLIYLTDGECSAPSLNFIGRILWVLSSSSQKADHLPGRTIKLN